MPDIKPVKPPKMEKHMTVNDLGIKFREALIKIDILNSKLEAVDEVCGKHNK